MHAPAEDRPGGADRAAATAVAFVRLLRRRGVRCPATAGLRYAEALAAVGIASRESAYWAGRATLGVRHEDVACYDAAFDAFWLGVVGDVPEPTAPPAPARPADESGPEDQPAAPPAAEPEPDADAPGALRYSAAETLRRKDFAACTPEELAEAQRLMGELRLSGPRRRTRRRRPVAGVGDRPDLRRTVRAALGTGGEPVRRRWAERDSSLRRLVLLCDVSGSMADYARPLLRLCQVAVASGRPTEAFTIGTRLTRVTRALSARDPDAAIGAAAAEVADWSGGTRLGEALRAFNDRFGVRGMARGAVVVVVSDGWDRGDPAELGAEMARLHRVAHRVVWVNPLKVTPGYAPLVRGMAAALPHVDDFLEGHSVESLERLARVVAGADRAARGGAGGTAGRQAVGAPGGRPAPTDPSPGGVT